MQNFRTPYRGRFENNNVFKKLRVEHFFIFIIDHSNGMREHLYTGAISTCEKNIHAAMHIRISKIVNFYCFNFLQLPQITRDHTRMVKVAQRA